ncbi:hypothetical protein VT569_02070 [Flavobacterium psychrophilum]|uniref:hypothetical protein n=1 Tax=Flavobacterium psychrophilum TaxID=96345 RepID=UPI000B6EE8F3|nr:hypothetical protein [Flavobacterium psychrophilum]SNB22047.1 conserved hypothetical protein [Flavobacterium psychrophilum]SNB97181.1 conserved hypothetical protein [Flavobacterium psychrophilum]GAW88678.1 hypothetical protein FPS14_contig00008-0062 [Flavobacterium psychrophilum]GEJ31016.1 hypothetical protein FPN186_contig00132-0004 [Flavobacterium psychrophilum]GEJ31162.1 hypothetical protein FPN185_contig00050-0004 [Flavobacterium psychrophilum]
MTKKPDISKLYNYHNEEGVLLEMSSDYKLISRELKSINVDYEKRAIHEIIQELTEIRTLYYLEFCDENNVLDPDIIDDEDFIKINFLIAYMENLKLYLQEQHKINTKTHSKC